MRGTVTIAPGVDLTEPVCPEWAYIAEESCVPFLRTDSGRRGEEFE
jgi:hypothetical protein